MTCDDAGTEPVTAPVRRLEVFTGAGRRRRWSAEEKARIVTESFSGAETVSAVARRHGLAASQLFAWRRAAEAGPAFVPVVISDTPARRAAPIAATGVIELEASGIIVRIGSGADAATISAVVRALRM